MIPIEKEMLKLVIKEFQENPLPENIIKRRTINVDLDSKSIVAIYGPRQSGKTYYFYQLINSLVEKNVEKIAFSI